MRRRVVAWRGYVLEGGKIVAEGMPDDLLSQPHILRGLSGRRSERLTTAPGAAFTKWVCCLPDMGLYFASGC